MSRFVYGLSLILSLLTVRIRLHEDRKPLALSRLWSIELDEEKESEKLQKERRRRRRVAPPNYKNPRPRLRSRCHYISTRSRNIRDLNQRSIRRKCING